MTKIGDTIELIHTSDPYTNLKPGNRGTVRFIDSLGTIAVRWDSGSTLGLVPGEDTWKIVNKGGN
jgi:hypothetical protein